MSAGLYTLVDGTWDRSTYLKKVGSDSCPGTNRRSW